jgi:hypothetical protein
MANTKKKAKGEVKNQARRTSETVRYYTENYEDIATDLTKQVRDSYLSSMKLSLSLLEDNFKMLNQFIGQWISLQHQIYSSLVDMSNPRKGDVNFGKDLIDRAFAVQRDYIEEIRNLSERGIQKMQKEAKRGVERTDREVRENVS